MSEGNSDSTQQTEPYRLNFGKMFNDNEDGINNYITQMINKDLDSLYPETINNQNILNTQPQFNQLNIPVKYSSKSKWFNNIKTFSPKSTNHF